MRVTICDRTYGAVDDMRARLAEIDAEFSDRRFTVEARTEWDALHHAIEDAEREAMRAGLTGRSRDRRVAIPATIDDDTPADDRAAPGHLRAARRPPDGARGFPRSHRRAWEQVRDAAGLPGLRVHDLRHAAATFWLAAGLTVHAVAELLGHVDAALVLRLYGHALPREVASAGERLEAWRAEQRG